MNMSERGKQLLAEWEGFECEVYRDAAGLPTIGVGHLLTKDELASGKIAIQRQRVSYTNGLTEQQVMDLLAQDLKRLENVVTEKVTVPLTQPQFDALVAFAFNVGGNAFTHSTLLRLLNQGKYDEVPHQLRRWVHSGGQKVRGLVNRREKEVALWNEAKQPVTQERALIPFGQRVMKRGLKGADVEELQIRLAGFSGTAPDGKFGPATELQVKQFQRDVMNMAKPTGVVDQATMKAIDAFAEQFPIDFDTLQCPCGVCGGFGQGRFKGEYLSGQPKTERFHRYEYPGMHRMLLWAVRAVFFYNPDYAFDIAAGGGYRCEVHNTQQGRTTTNHHGKALDLDPRPLKNDHLDDKKRCDTIRDVIVNTAKARIGWRAANRKALEPARIAPTWVHYDVRRYAPKYLDDRFFCKSLEELNGP